MGVIGRVFLGLSWLYFVSRGTDFFVLDYLFNFSFFFFLIAAAMEDRNSLSLWRTLQNWRTDMLTPHCKIFSPPKLRCLSCNPLWIQVSPCLWGLRVREPAEMLPLWLLLLLWVINGPLSLTWKSHVLYQEANLWQPNLWQPDLLACK